MIILEYTGVVYGNKTNINLSRIFRTFIGTPCDCKVQQMWTTNWIWVALMTDARLYVWKQDECHVNSCGTQLPGGVTVDTMLLHDNTFAALLTNEQWLIWNGVEVADDKDVHDDDKYCHLRPDALNTGVDNIYSNRYAFAAKLCHGRLATWGYANYGGDSRSVQPELKAGVDTVYRTEGAFAAKLNDGRLVTWGHPCHGGDSRSVQADLKTGVDTVCSTDSAFAAKLNDGRVVTWGDADHGGDSRSVQAELKAGVDTIYSTRSAFAAKLSDGRVVTWGDAFSGGDSRSVQAELKAGVDTIYSTSWAFAAKLTNGGVVTWGNPHCGGDTMLKTGVDTIYSNYGTFVAKLTNGGFLTWGLQAKQAEATKVNTAEHIHVYTFLALCV